MSMPWWLGLPVLVVWGFVVVGIYALIGLLWLMWFLGQGISRFLTGTDQRVTETMPATASLPPPRALLPSTSMNAEVPAILADLRSRFQAELDATSALPDQRSRLQAELDVRTRFGEALSAALGGEIGAAMPPPTSGRTDML